MGERDRGRVQHEDAWLQVVVCVEVRRSGSKRQENLLTFTKKKKSFDQVRELRIQPQLRDSTRGGRQKSREHAKSGQERIDISFALRMGRTTSKSRDVFSFLGYAEKNDLKDRRSTQQAPRPIPISPDSQLDIRNTPPPPQKTTHCESRSPFVACSRPPTTQRDGSCWVVSLVSVQPAFSRPLLLVKKRQNHNDKRINHCDFGRFSFIDWRSVGAELRSCSRSLALESSFGFCLLSFASPVHYSPNFRRGSAVAWGAAGDSLCPRLGKTS